MAGLFAAIFLHRRGWHVDVVERAHGLADRGAGIVTHDPLYEGLRTAGVTLRPEMGVHSGGRILLDREGAITSRYDMKQVFTSWGLTYRFLREQLPDDRYHLGVALDAIEPQATHCDAILSNGSTIRSDWLIAADGTHSTVRQLVAPETIVHYCGYFLWRGLTEERLVPPPVLAELEETMAFGMAPGGHWLGYLVAGEKDELEPGRRRYNWGWYRTANAARLRDVLTDDAGAHHANGIPHDRIREELRNEMRAEAERCLAPQIQTVIEATESAFLQPVYDLGCDRLVHGRVVLIGDAAFTARPHVGMGVTKAAEDASTLAVALDAAPAATNATLAAWEKARLAYGRAVVASGRDLGSYIGPAPEDEQHRAKAEYYQRPEVLLSMTAASLPSTYLSR